MKSMMFEFNVEQFVYSSAFIKKGGYQIIAKSQGITDDIISQLKSYLYPIGVNSKKFTESISLILLDNDLIAYSKIKNVGISFDGRDNTLYNHTLITSKKNFRKYNNDSRIFNRFYLEDKTIQGDLPTLKIDPIRLSYPTDIILPIPLLSEILYSIFTNNKIAILLDNMELLQKIIAFLPISMRLISFSTYVVEPDKQPKYNLVLNSKLDEYQLNKKFKIISPDKITTYSSNTLFKQSIEDYARWIILYDYKKVQEIQDLFEKISGNSNKDKLVLITNIIQFRISDEKGKKSNYANIILGILKKFDQTTFEQYFKEIKNSLDLYKKIESIIPSSTDTSMDFIGKLLYHSEKVKKIIPLLSKI